MNLDTFKQQINNQIINFFPLLLDNYKALGLDDNSCIIILHLIRQKQNKVNVLSISTLEKLTSLSYEAISEMVHNLIRLGNISIEMKINTLGKQTETFSLDPLYEKVFYQVYNGSVEVEQEGRKNYSVNILNKGELLSLFENEFGRPISQIEGEKIATWVDEYGFNINLIKAALSEAVLANKLNLRYIEAILMNWRRGNIRTEKELKAQKNHQTSPMEKSVEYSFTKEEMDSLYWDLVGADE